MLTLKTLHILTQSSISAELNHPAGSVLLAISEWNPLPLPGSSTPSPSSTIPRDMLTSCHEILAAHASGEERDVVLKLCGLRRSAARQCDDDLRAAACFAAYHEANAASYALVMQARWHCIRVVFHEMIARIVKRDVRRRCRQVGTESNGVEGCKEVAV
jgi:hypothetical protein